MLEMLTATATVLFIFIGGAINGWETKK